MSVMNYGTNFRAPRVDVHDFSMIPRADIPRSTFRMQQQHKTTIQCSFLVPVYLQEILPGDTWNVNMSVYARLATPVYPIMDTLSLESFFFFVPNRLVWFNWQKFMGEQDNPTDSISYVIPTVLSPVGGFDPLSIYDYFGIPTSNQLLPNKQISVNALPLRAYNLIFNEWFRDENLDNSAVAGSSGLPANYINMDNGPDSYLYYPLRFANKRHDYFTSCLPWTQKGGTAVTLPLGSSAPVRTFASSTVTGAAPALQWLSAGGSGTTLLNEPIVSNPAGSAASAQPVYATTSANPVYPSNLYADLSTATAATINAIRLAFQTQKLLERDARGGTRYTEIIRSHFGVLSPDARQMRPEYLGGGKTPVTIAPVPQTTATGLTGGNSPLGNLAAVGTTTARQGFRYSSTEHGHIIGLVVARADQLYQQGLRKLWSRSTRYDFYWPVFQALGEQAVLNKEIYCNGDTPDNAAFGYQERWAEYRYHPSYTSAYFNSTNATPLDAWHLGIKFGGLPTLNSTFIADATQNVVERAIAAGSQGNQQQLLIDFFFDQRAARPMPMWSVPGMADHF